MLHTEFFAVRADDALATVLQGVKFGVKQDTE
jgi:hypothetical protein